MTNSSDIKLEQPNSESKGLPKKDNLKGAKTSQTTKQVDEASKASVPTSLVTPLAVPSATFKNAKRIKDSQGKLKTLQSGKFSFIPLRAENLIYSSSLEPSETHIITKKKVLFLGLGYNAIKDAVPLCSGAEEIFYLEHEAFTNACFDADIETTLPAHFTQISVKALYTVIGAEGNKLSDWEFMLFKQNMELFPKFWNEFLINLQDFLDKKFPIVYNHDAKVTASIFIAGSTKDLVYKELCDAVSALGFECLTMASITGTTDNASTPLISQMTISNQSSFSNSKGISEDAMILNIINTLKSKKPEFFLSINGRNLDSNGKMAASLDQLKIPLVLWILDNPWNILSGFKQDWWKECILYVTDESFVPMLEAHGAKKVSCLPLAASTHSMHINNDIPRSNLLFVGNSSFPDKDKFFAAVSKQLEAPLVVCKNLINKFFEAAQTNPKAESINFHQIYSYLYPSKQQNLWPGNEFRFVSYLASECDTYQKTHWLNTLSNTKVIGDKAWEHLLKNPSRISPPVDYYTQLPSYYAASNFTINISSPLLPNALTQRHFDVWLAGGFLLSTPTRGLGIFQSDILSLTLVNSPEKAFEIMGKFAKKPSIYNEVKRSMVANIVANHFYSHRIITILNRF